MSHGSKFSKGNYLPLQDLRPLFRDSKAKECQMFHSNWFRAKGRWGREKTWKFERIEMLGSGSSAIVWVIKRNDLGEGNPREFVAKVVNKIYCTSGKLWSHEELKYIEQDVKNEASLLARMRHKNVLMCYGAFENTTEWVLVFEYARGGELLHRLKKVKYFNEHCVVHYVRQMVDAVAYIHSLGIVHRDLKPQNFFIKQAYTDDSPCTNDRILLGDFEIATQLEGDIRMKRFCGSLGYIAPELARLYVKQVFKEDGYEKASYSKSVDIWSLGATAFLLLYGSRIYNHIAVEDKDRKTRFCEINAGLVITDDHIETISCMKEKSTSEKGIAFLCSSLCVNPETRKTANDLVEIANKWHAEQAEQHNLTYWDFDTMKAWRRALVVVETAVVLNATIRKRHNEKCRDSGISTLFGKRGFTKF